MGGLVTRVRGVMLPRSSTDDAMSFISRRQWLKECSWGQSAEGLQRWRGVKPRRWFRWRFPDHVFTRIARFRVFGCLTLVASPASRQQPDANKLMPTATENPSRCLRTCNSPILYYRRNTDNGQARRPVQVDREPVRRPTHQQLHGPRDCNPPESIEQAARP